MKNTIIVAVCVTLLLACSHNKIQVNNSTLKTVVKENDENMSLFSDVIIFYKCNNSSKIGYIFYYELIDIMSNLNDLEKESYINDFIDGKLQEEIIPLKSFQFDNSVKEEYKKMSFNDFIAKYCDILGDQSFSLKSDFSKSTKFTVLYYCYLNNYYSVFDEYIGSYMSRSFIKMKSLEDYLRIE